VEYGFKPKNTILVHDKYLPSGTLDDLVKEAEFVFICVPTPMNRQYTKIGTAIVEEVFANTVKLARKLKKEPVIVIKSTVVPGTTRRLARKHGWPATLFNPEFLTEDNYLRDFVNADRIVIGGDAARVRQKLADLYRASFNDIPIFQTDPTTAETVKYMANTYLATKVIFANEMFELCGKLGVKYEEVKKMTVADRRIFDSHLNVTSERGFGKKCFPKDTVAILGLARELGADLSVLKAVWKKNLKIRKIRDWENIPGAVSKKS
jgi:UDPglucose 6-dehydrogenase